MRVYDKKIKKYLDNICTSVAKIRNKSDTSETLKNINILLSKKVLDSPFKLNTIKFNESNQCLGVCIVPSIIMIKQIASKIYTKDDVDSLYLALFKTSKLQFDLILDRKIFDTSHPSLVFSNAEITTMIFRQILSLYSDDFKTQMLLNIIDMVNHIKGFGGTAKLLCNSFYRANKHDSYILYNNYDERIDEIVVILGLYKYLVSALNKSNTRGDLVDTGLTNNIKKLFGDVFSNNSIRIERINTFNKTNTSNSVDLTATTYYNEECEDMYINDLIENHTPIKTSNKHELSFLHEAYFGKNKSVMKIEEIFNECIEHVKKYNTAMTKGSLDFKCSKYVNTNLAKIEDIVIKEFGFYTASIRVNHGMPSVNAFTYITTEMFQRRKMVVKATKDGVKYIDGASFICEIGDAIFCGNYTAGEITAILLHEIGHKFYRNNNKEFSAMILATELMILLSTYGVPVWFILENINDFKAKIFKSSPGFRNVCDTIKKINESFSKFLIKIILFVNTFTLVPVVEMYSAINSFINGLLNGSAQGITNERFADNFASAYGYSVELASGLRKMSLEPQVGDSIPIVTYLKDLTSFYPNLISMMFDEHPPTYDRIVSQHKFLKKELEASKMDKKTKAEINKQLDDIDKMIKAYPKEVVENQKMRGRYFTAMAYALAAKDPNDSKLHMNKRFNNKVVWDQFKDTEGAEKILNADTDFVFEDVNPRLASRVDNLSKTIQEVKFAYKDGKHTELQSAMNDFNKSLNDLCKYFNKPIKIEQCIINTENGSSSEDMFGARAIPHSMSTLDAHVSRIIHMESMDKILTNLFKNVSFIIEIDHNILDTNKYDFTNDEILAIILHELGHTLDPNIYSRTAMAYQSAMINLGNMESLKSNTNTKALCALYIISNIEADRIFTRDRKSITVEEIRADSFVGNLGLSKELNSALDKFMKINTHTFFKEKTFKEMIADAENFVQASLVYYHRKRKINRLILTEKIKQKSYAIKKLLDNISKNVLVHGDSTITNGDIYVKDNSIGGVINESFDFIKKFRKSPNRISSYDIDSLRIQSDMIEDIEDKQIMLYKIFKRKTQISELLKNTDFIEENKEYELILNSYMNTLDELYKKVMSVKINNQIQKYGVFIKYPKGYEG